MTTGIRARDIIVKAISTPVISRQNQYMNIIGYELQINKDCDAKGRDDIPRGKAY
jgi:hypothetical protein